MVPGMPWWFPERADAVYFDRLRKDYSDYAAWSDAELCEEFNQGRKYVTPWDHAGDAYEEYEKLADAYLALLERYPDGRPA